MLAAIVLSSVLIVVAKVPEPTTTAANTAAKTRAYSSMSWPDSSRWKLLMICLIVIWMSPFFRFLVPSPVLIQTGFMNSVNKTESITPECYLYAGGHR